MNRRKRRLAKRRRDAAAYKRRWSAALREAYRHAPVCLYIDPSTDPSCASGC